MEIPSNKEIYAKAKREAANIMTEEQIALNAMHDLRKLLEKHPKTQKEPICLTCEGRFFM